MNGYRYPVQAAPSSTLRMLVRIGLVSPYSWSYQGGVNRHVEALAEEFLGAVTMSASSPRSILPARSAVPRTGRCRRAASCPTTWCRWDAPSASAPTARSPTSRSCRSPATSAPPRGPRRRLRRHPRPRAARAAGRLECRARRADAGRRHLPRLLDQAVPELPRERRRRAPDVQPPLGADRRLRGGRLDRQALVRRRVHDHPQRRRCRRRRRPGSNVPGGGAAASSSSVAPRSARACRSCSPPSTRWSSTSPRG